jgi:murein DD-endopeptidase MepM/ murein hydrolase activator NlpD
MNRTTVIALVILLLVAGGVYVAGILGDRGPAYSIGLTLYDTDADGAADLTVERIDGVATLWRWDRDADGNPEIVAYDAAVDAQGNLAPTGNVTAWDYGADGILDEGAVPDALQAILRSEELATARATSGAGQVDLVDMQTRGFVAELNERFDAWRLAGFRMPIVGASLPRLDRLLPGAPRAYRFGVHQGFDMYEGQIGVPTGYGGPVVAAKNGSVVRADVDYVEMTPEEYAEAIAISQAAGTTPPEQLDQLRGRQVWIDHGNGVITRYAHLSGIAPDIRAGVQVEAGDVIAFVGNSGMEAGAQGARSGAHLHFELRIDDRYFGEGMSAAQIRERAQAIFDLPAPR